MKNKVLFTLFILPLIAAAIILYFINNKPTSKTKFSIGIVNTNQGTKAIQEAFMVELEKDAMQEGWQLSFYKCENKDSFDNDLKKLVSKHPDLILTVTTPGTIKAQKAFKGQDVPGVFVVYDPVEAGIIKSLSEPGGNFTGIQKRGSVPKCLELLLGVSPDIKDIFVPIKFDTKSATMSLNDLKTAAKSIGAKLNVAEVNTEEELGTALDAIPEETDAIFLLNSIFISTNADTIIHAAISKKLPTAASIGREKEGVLLTYSAPHELSGKQASRLAYLILHGQNQSELPAEIADFYYTVNLKTAKRINLKLPEKILAQADKVIR